MPHQALFDAVLTADVVTTITGAFRRSLLYIP
jgi:hypothetical protein